MARIGAALHSSFDRAATLSGAVTAYGSPDKKLKLGERELECYVLEDGKRVLSGRGMQEALGLGQAHGGLLREFLAQKSITPFISNDLAMELSSPIRFIRPGVGIGFLSFASCKVGYALGKLICVARALGMLWHAFTVTCQCQTAQALGFQTRPLPISKMSVS